MLIHPPFAHLLVALPGAWLDRQGPLTMARRAG
jgi:hypothetical protein